ncbi:hypothetical protein A0H76_890 [Hepatospora eriocheir]|uniref:Uncharacterized protein n=1 Tax=Hepatospora eriocheir TaxID=1081669 RepID=A0A1X0Q6H8_9MICR|nr:hypothetical protein A0H76_890 [Hepatospora eriocheir]
MSFLNSGLTLYESSPISLFNLTFALFDKTTSSTSLGNVPSCFSNSSATNIAGSSTFLNICVFKFP